uniref:Estrogen receptor beta n=1 Tax=Echinostoma caproni TaxID=27848 RepID=A0A183BDZ0_9TREM
LTIPERVHLLQRLIHRLIELSMITRPVKTMKSLLSREILS